MMIQNQILRTLGASALRPSLSEKLRGGRYASRRAFVLDVCETYGFRNALGELQEAGCTQALVELERRGRIVLPDCCGHGGHGKPVCLDAPVPAPRFVPSVVEDVRGLALETVVTRSQRAIWNTLMDREHPRGTTTFAGCQVRYLVVSSHGFLGGLGFSASALRLRARDEWMAWDADKRARHLSCVICLSRFLIRPGLECRNLASKVLGLTLRRLGGDFEDRYGYRPWLVESFVGPEWDGAVLKAANFIPVGYTSGRGRNDRTNDRAETVKAVYMYELEPNWRRRLGVPNVEAQPRLAPGEGLDSAVWARNEFGGAALGDARLQERLVKSASLLAQAPQRSISGCAQRDRAAIDGWYRLIDKPEDSAVTCEAILGPHRNRTIQRMRAQDVVLCVQDGSDLRFATRPACKGLSTIGRNQTGAEVGGLHLHATLAVSGDGLPLGVLRYGFDPIPGEDRVGENAGNDEVEDRPKTQRWIDGLHDISRAAQELSNRTQLLSVMDREADFFGLFDEARRLHGVEVLVRAKHDRCLAEAPKLFARMRSGPVQADVRFTVDPQKHREKSSRKKARPARQARIQALFQLRWRSVELPSTIEGVDPVRMSVVHIVEAHPPEGEKAIEWFLLTSLDVATAADAERVLGYYLKRWRIEEFFRVLKSGCKVQELRFQNAIRLHRAVSVNAVIAWRIMVMTLLGREVPDLPPEVMFTDDELTFLNDYSQDSSLNIAPTNLRNAILIVAILGGYRNRKQDPPPGNEAMWHGYTYLAAASYAYGLASRVRMRPEQLVAT